MKAKTKLQKQIVELSATLPAITEKQSAYAYENCLSKWALISRGTTFCTECGHKWKEENLTITPTEEIICPQCGCNLKLKAEYENTFKDRAYFGILTTRGGFQVVRILWVSKTLKKSTAASYHSSEVMQHWIMQDGKHETLSMKVNSMSQYYDQWVWGSELEFHTIASQRAVMRYDLSPHKTYPMRSVLPAFRKIGFKGDFHYVSPLQIFPYIQTNKRAETLLKAGQEEMFYHGFHHPNKTEKYWPSIRICMRNGYIIKDATIWLDTMELLSYFGKDLNNAFYVCPENINQLHDRLVAKKLEIKKKEKLEKRQSQMAKDQIKYMKKMGKFFDICFGNDEFTIAPLQSVQEFYNEGNELHHCVYANEYYKTYDSLILSARIQNKPIETIEVSLKDMTILQSRGLQNQPTEHHDKIIQLVTQNINLIRQKAS